MESKRTRARKPTETKLKIYSAYDPSVRQAAPDCPGGVTEQHHEKACNINNIVAKYAKTGLVDHVQNLPGRYGDVTGADFQAAQNLVAEQVSLFNELPAEVRGKFENDPAIYLDLLATDQGIDTLAGMLDDEMTDKRSPEIVQETASDEAEGEGEAEKSAVT